ncbi:hypothetical protein CHU95_03005 [Niveispirillum lacus]|uniref:Uncharacterized protein n=1 Tax=Niveispirillum lacus TaxID=1981099 RepID=A0A255Z8M2_9PROT|nr:hypothetical protein CHU95_03005 [Niveispirillum lacus]
MGGNMAKRAWFVPKSHGIGYSPAGWQGWLATSVFILILVGGTKLIQTYVAVPPGPWLPVIGLTWVAFAGGVFFLIARSRTEGEVCWRWGSRT